MYTSTIKLRFFFNYHTIYKNQSKEIHQDRVHKKKKKNQYETQHF